MNTLTLTGLDGSNPLALLAALGVLVALDEARRHGDPAPRLAWRLDGVWRPVLHTALPSLDDVVAVLDADRLACVAEPALRFTYPEGDKDVADVKPSPAFLRATLLVWVALADPGARRTLDWFTSFISEGAVDNNGRGKPTALHFAAGQQRFLKAARELAEGAVASDLRAAIEGPWTALGMLPVMGWDNTDCRDYALRAINPSTDKKLGDPGADWLALRGLGLLSTAANDGEQRTPGVRGGWKSGAFAWPLWTTPASRDVARSLLATPRLRELPASERARRGIGVVFESRILRSDQGGYGSVSPATVT